MKTFRKEKRIIKVFNSLSDKCYYDKVTCMFIYELLDAATFGYAVWAISKTHLLNSNIFQGSFQKCKDWLYNVFPDNEFEIDAYEREEALI